MKFIPSLFIALCLFFLLPQNTHAQALTPEQKAQLEQELAQVEAAQKQAEKDLASAQGQSASLQRDISVLTAKINVAQLNIRAKNLLIEGLGKDIKSKETHIGNLEDRIDHGREILAQIMRKIDETDSITLPEIILAQNTLSDVFIDIDSLESVQQGLKVTFEQIRDDKEETEVEKNTLDKRRNSEVDARYVIQREQKSIKANEDEKRRLLGNSKLSEKTYSSILAEKQKKAAQIRAVLFPLAGGSKSIPFGEALKYAQKASQVTGIRPAFLLAIITQESNLGANVGSCYMTDTTTGNGVGKNTGTAFEQVMKAPRDTVPFLEITESLGRDWKTTPVSCPIGSTKYYSGRGFGGGMGPAQFIPSTWMLFKNRIATAFGITTPDPWNNEHAFTASSFYLTDLGASGGSYTGEIRAACKYFGSGGASCSYGTQVLSKADVIQRTMIDPLQGV